MMHRIMGGDGWLSAAAAVMPKHMRGVDGACAQGRRRDVQQRLIALQPVFDALALEPYPATVKHAVAPLGISGQVRLPLVAASPNARRTIGTALGPFNWCGWECCCA
jgi:4-hydroxy-tetrahydrodipicolinate synthase